MRSFIPVVSLVCLLCAPAMACWSGHHVSLDGVTLLSSDTQLDVARVRAYAVWLPRIAAITPPGVAISTDDTPAQSAFAQPGWCTGAGETFACEPLKWDETLPSLFDAVRIRSAASKAQVDAAMRMPTQAPVTIQVGYGDVAWADAYSKAINARLRDAHLPLGFVTYGGAPASPQVAFVVKRRSQYAVIIGVFAGRAQAGALAKRLAGEGVEGFIRPL